MSGLRCLASLRRATVALGVGITLVAVPPGVRAQQAATFTLDDVLTSLRRGADTLDLARVSPVQSQALDSVSLLLRSSAAASLTIDDLAAIVTKSHASFADVARWNPQSRAPWAESWFYDALVRLRRIANAAGTGIGPRLVAAFGSTVADHFIAPMDELETKIIRRAQAKNAEKLRRYEIKYGPESARLNIAELLVNYLVARPSWSPLASGEDGPNPLEIVAMYSTTELTGSKSADDKFRPRIVGGAYSGLRYYRFGADTMPRSRLKTFFAPHFISAGMLFTGSTDRALISPFENGMRKGGFLEWGAARVGATLGHDWRVVIGVGNQILPYVF